MRPQWMITALIGLTGCITDHEPAKDSAPTVGESPFTQAQLMAAYLLANTCEAKPVRDDFVELLNALAQSRGKTKQALHQIITCLNTAADCDAVKHCTLGNVNVTDIACDDEQFVEHCDGMVLVRCRNFGSAAYTEHREDCADDRHGNTVCVDADGWATCAATGPCEASRCEGNIQVYCNSPALSERRDCAQQNQICTLDSEGDPQCVVATSGCTPCDGDVMQRCGDEGEIFNRFDCSTMGLGCQPRADRGNRGQCMPEEPTCENGDADRCTGTVAEVCLFNQWQAHDCSLIDADCVIREGSAYCEQ